MKFVTFSTSNTSIRTGLLLEDGIQPLPFPSLMDLIQAGDAGLERVRSLKDKSRVPLDEARLHAPLSRPTTLRDAICLRDACQNRQCQSRTRSAGGMVQVSYFLFHKSE